MRKLSNCNKNNLLENPGKILISNFRSNLQPQTWKLSIMSATSILPFDLAWSAGVCKGYQNKWQETLSHFEFWNASSKHQKGIHCSSLSHTLSDQKNHPSLPVWLFSSHMSDLPNKKWVKRFHTLPLKDKWEERRDEEYKWKNKTRNNWNQKCQIHNTKEYLILRWRST